MTSTLTAAPVAATAAGPREEPSRTARFGRALAVYGSLKLAGFAVFLYLLHHTGDFRDKNPRFGGGARPWDVLATWDGWWYQQVAAHGYQPALVPVPGAAGPITLEGNSAAFFPLYPAAMRLVSEVTGLGLYGAGMLVSVLASFVAALGVYAVTARLGGHCAGLCAAGLWAVWPGSGTEWSGYSESLYVALAVWACHAVMSRRWLTAGLLTFTAGLARPTATALIGALVLSALPALRKPRADGVARPLTAIVIAPLGLFGYLAWVGHRMGDPAGYFKLQEGAWAHTFDWGRHTVEVFTSVAVGDFDYLFACPIEDVIGICVVVLALALIPVLVRLRLPLVLVVYTVLTVVTVLGTQQIFGNVSRYLLPAFPLFVPPALALARARPADRAALLGFAALASGSYAGYVLFELGVP
ncbi:hypothetical protein ACIF70_34020 [Actinacidiphila glaucinigra]|uniref:hypothetical protein n=1 Tax=Actinacidiphila glaucinigra TaxID=235986 RepID=UPI0037CCAF29